jgi:glutamate racemase
VTLSNLPIGVFDSGVGGLTVLAALAERLPAESYLYLGDTARLPYGTKTAETVERYALQAVAELVRRGVKAVVVACNTASAAALPALMRRWPELPITGVIEPGAAAAVAVSKSGRIAVLATEGTVKGGAYQRAIATLRPNAVVTSIPATLFVALAEEGWVSGEITKLAARVYLEPVFAGDVAAPDTLVLGCTHFPPLAAAIRSVTGPNVTVVDSAATTAVAVQQMILARSLSCARATSSTTRFLVTDGEERFQRIGPRFLGRALQAANIERVDL